MLERFGPFNEGSLVLLGEWGPAWLVLFGTLALVLCAMTWLDLAPLSYRRRGLVVGLRASTLCLAIALLMEPALELKEVLRVPNHIAVLVDTSESQALPTADGETRFARARERVEALDAWRERVGPAGSEEHLVPHRGRGHGDETCERFDPTQGRSRGGHDLRAFHASAVEARSMALLHPSN